MHPVYNYGEINMQTMLLNYISSLTKILLSENNCTQGNSSFTIANILYYYDLAIVRTLQQYIATAASIGSKISVFCSFSYGSCMQYTQLHCQKRREKKIIVYSHCSVTSVLIMYAYVTFPSKNLCCFILCSVLLLYVHTSMLDNDAIEIMHIISAPME